MGPMEPKKQLPGAFRRHLHAELQQWLAEGLVTPGQAEALEQRYALKAAAAPRIGAFTAFLYGLGALLIGGGVIAFVAANWEGIPVPARFVGLIVLMVFFQGAGFHWWKGGQRPAAGHALVLLGAVLFGANIGLVGQMFHLDGKWSSGFGVWAFGCALISYATGSVPVAMLGLFASSVAYFGGLAEETVRGAMPVLIGLQAIPFALRHKSRVMLFAGLALVFATLCVGGVAHSGGLLGLASALVCGILFVLAEFTLAAEERMRPLGRVAQVVAALCIGGTLFLASIGWVTTEALNFERGLSYDRGFAPLLTGLFGVLALVWAGPALMRLQKAPEQAPFVGALLLACVAPLAALFTQSDTVVWGVSMLAFAGATLALVWVGLAQRDRLLYSIGTLLLGSRLLLYFLFVDTGLTMKALFMVVGGVAVVAVALQFERWAGRIAPRAPGDTA